MTAQQRQNNQPTQRACYRYWRRIVRANGWYALRWMPEDVRQLWERIRQEIDSVDDLADRQSVVAYAKKVGLDVTPWHTTSRRLLDYFQERAKNATHG